MAKLADAQDLKTRHERDHERTDGDRPRGRFDVPSGIFKADCPALSRAVFARATIPDMTQALHEGISHVVHLSTNIGKGCEHCGTFIDSEDLAKSINHYITTHGYRLLHTGSETIHGSDGKPWHTTVAIVGK